MERTEYIGFVNLIATGSKHDECQQMSSEHLRSNSGRHRCASAMQVHV